MVGYYLFLKIQKNILRSKRYITSAVKNKQTQLLLFFNVNSTLKQKLEDLRITTTLSCFSTKGARLSTELSHPIALKLSHRYQDFLSNTGYAHFSPTAALSPYRAPHPTPVAYRMAKISAEYLDVTTI